PWNRLATYLFFGVSKNGVFYTCSSINRGGLFYTRSSIKKGYFKNSKTSTLSFVSFNFSLFNFLLLPLFTTIYLHSSLFIFISSLSSSSLILHYFFPQFRNPFNPNQFPSFQRRVFCRITKIGFTSCQRRWYPTLC
ncbi:MAG: hypothetical protein RLY89_2014, partial [Bacteroidota bacterium]